MNVLLSVTANTPLDCVFPPPPLICTSLLTTALLRERCQVRQFQTASPKGFALRSTKCISGPQTRLRPVFLAR